MNDERMRQVESIFCGAVDLEGPRLEAYLSDRCGDDLSLRRYVLNLIDRDQSLKASIFVEQSPSQATAARQKYDSFYGTQLGAFKLTRHLGSGGMGEVFLGIRDDEFEQQAAIKVIRAGIDSEAMAVRFRKEMQFLAALGKHPGITSILDAGTTASGQLFIAMDYVDGQPINEYCDSNRLGIRERLRLFCRACDAVQFAHQNAVLHRDLKPSNLLVAASGQPILIDFGVAKVIEEQNAIDAEQQRTQHQPFTPGYASPEQLQGQPTTTATDVYALGVILYELLSGHTPHALAGRSLAETVKLVCETDPTKPSNASTNTVDVRRDDPEAEELPLVVTPEELAELRSLGSRSVQSELRGDLDRIVLKAMDRDVDQRYATVEQLTDDIQRFLSGHPVYAQRNSWGYRAKKYVRRNAWQVTAAAAFVLMLVSGVAITSRLAFVANRSAAAEREQRAIASRAAEVAVNAAQAEKEQRVLAEKRERTANEILEIFDDLLASADPRKTGRPDYAVRDLVGELVKELDSKSVDDPVVKARLHQSIASALVATGDYRAAVRHLREAKWLLFNNLGPSHVATLAATLRHCQTLMLNQDPKVAIRLLERIVDMNDPVREQDPDWNLLQFRDRPGNDFRCSVSSQQCSVRHHDYRRPLS